MDLDIDDGLHAGDPTACDACLRRTVLVAELGTRIQRVAYGPNRARPGELLSLSDDELVEAVAGSAGAEILEHCAAVEPADVRGDLELAGLWACCHHDPSYPPGLAEAPDAPAMLSGAGDPFLLRRLVPERSVTIVGARRAGRYGLEVARTLCSELAAAGMIVVSGLANGIDAAAHEGALTGGGMTVAVLAGGADRAAPRSQLRLYRRVRQSGLVLSEALPGARPYKWSFPARNRIMAAIAAMTVVVEAATKSGSLITAELAQDLGRELGAVPGPVTSSLSSGANALLAEGAAIVRDAGDVLDAMLGPGRARPRAASGPAIDEPLRRAIRYVEAGNGTADALAAESGLSAAEAVAALGRLELLGYARAGADGRYARTTLTPPPAAGA